MGSYKWLYSWLTGECTMKLLKHMNQPQPGSMLSVVYVVSKIEFIFECNCDQSLCRWRA